jgi:hypothetical protein
MADYATAAAVISARAGHDKMSWLQSVRPRVKIALEAAEA